MGIRSGLGDLMTKCREHAEYLNGSISKTEGDPRGTCFWSMYNRVKITEEIISVYDRRWSPDIISKLDESGVSEIYDRIVTVTRDMYVDIVSAVEKAVKDCLKMYPSSKVKENALDKNNRLYLRNILMSSCEAGVIDKNTMKTWDDLLMIRNLAVHENSVSDRTMILKFGDAEINMRAGRMMKGPLGTYVILTDLVTDMFFDWLTAMHGMFSQS